MARNFVPVSVIIPILNGSRWIDEALSSVAAQTYMPSEIIVIDGGSSDNSEGIVKEFNSRPSTPDTRFILQDQVGASSKRNAGAEIAKGDYLSFLDADDVWPEERTECLLGPFLENHNLECVSGKMQQFISSTTSVGSRKILGDPTPTRLPSTSLIKRSAFEKVGKFNTLLDRGETIEWWSRAVDSGLKMASIDCTTLLRRIHSDNLGRTRPNPGGDYLKMLHQVLTRRRESGSAE